MQRSAGGQGLHRTVLLKLSMCEFEYLVLENRPIIVTEIAIEMDIGASSVKINVLEKLGMRKITVIYTFRGIL